MIGSFLTRALVMVFGYAYPAYECYKTVEMNKPEIEQLRFWCQYWILVTLLTVCERIGDAFVSWIPMYCEAKLAFFIYLWYPKTRGTTYVYDSFFRPYISKHETEIDRNLLELRTRAGDMVVLYWQRAASYGQTHIFEILQYVAAQSSPRPRPQPQKEGATARQPPTTTNRQAPAALTRQPSTPRAIHRRVGKQPVSEEPPSPTSSTSSSQQANGAEEAEEEVVAPKVSETAPTTTNRQPPTTTNRQAPAAPTRQPSTPRAIHRRVGKQPVSEEPLSPTSSTSSSQQANGADGAEGAEEEVVPPKVPETAPTPLDASTTPKAKVSTEISSQPAPPEIKETQVEAVPSSSGSENTKPKEALMEETMRVTRGRLRKTPKAGNN